MLVPVEGLAPALRLVPSDLDRLIIESGDETPAHIGAALGSGHAQLWLIGIGGKVAASVITRLEDRPTGRVLACPYATGERIDLWKGAFHDAALAFGRQVGAGKMEITGREGFLRKLAELGWVKVAAVYQVALDG